MDRSWMNESRLSPVYEEGMEQFLQFASERSRPDGNRKRQKVDDIRQHLLCDGIKRNYTTVGPAKLTDRPDHEVMWDATLFGQFIEDFPLYIKHEDLSEIAHGGQCLSISVIQLWILHIIETSMRAGNTDVYGFLEPQPDNYLKGIINSALKGLDDTQQSKSKPPARWIVVKCNRSKGSTECRYYVMHWMLTIISANFKNNWEMYFTDARPLEPERLKAFRIQWAKYYLKVKNET
ncbi:hypothetical protein HKD37_01G001245 [Glycine soja]